MTKFYEVIVSIIVEAELDEEAYEEVQRIMEKRDYWNSKVSELEIRWPTIKEESND